MRQRIIHLTKKDFTVQTFRAGGKGGQNQNARDSGVRIIHDASGARGESREHRTQPENKKAAFRRLVDSERFQTWLWIENARVTGELDRWVDDQMRPENLLIETF